MLRQTNQTLKRKLESPPHDVSSEKDAKRQKVAASTGHGDGDRDDQSKNYSYSYEEMIALRDKYVQRINAKDVLLERVRTTASYLRAELDEQKANDSKSAKQLEQSQQALVQMTDDRDKCKTETCNANRGLHRKHQELQELRNRLEVESGDDDSDEDDVDWTAMWQSEKLKRQLAQQALEMQRKELEMKQKQKTRFAEEIMTAQMQEIQRKEIEMLETEQHVEKLTARLAVVKTQRRAQSKQIVILKLQVSELKKEKVESNEFYETQQSEKLAEQQQLSVEQIHEASQPLTVLKEQYEATQVERDRFKLIAKSLLDQVCKGREPNRGLFPTAKSPYFTEWTDSVDALHKAAVDDVAVAKHNQKKVDAKTLSAIESSLTLNAKDGADSRNPFVQLGVDGAVSALDDVVSKLTLPRDYRIPALVGKFGVFSKLKITKGTVLGRYLGFECTEEEWHQIFDHTNCDMMHTPYLFDFKVGSGRWKKCSQIFIDPFEGKMQDLNLLYINDCRDDISQAKMHKKDNERMNCGFVVVKVHGWPAVFVVTTKNVEQGVELLLDYGELYWNNIKENDRWEKLHKLRNQRTLQLIIGDTKLVDHFQL